MKNKLKTLLIIVFICFLVLPFIEYFTKEGFTEKSPFGQWELVLRQSYNDQYSKSPFKGNTSVNINALYDSYGKINEPNYYNSSLYSNYDFSSNRILKINYYDTYESTTPLGTITWSQDKDNESTNVVASNSLDDDFPGIVLSMDEDHTDVDRIFHSVGNKAKYILGASQSYLDSIADITYIPGFPPPPTDVGGSTAGPSEAPAVEAPAAEAPTAEAPTAEADVGVGVSHKGVEKVELFLWNPRPNNKNTFNGNYKDIVISKVDMNDTRHKGFWNKREDISGMSDENTNRYSYCFGKLKCHDNDYTPIENSNGVFKPYCDSDSSLNPVYCEGSALYNTNNKSLNSVSIGKLSYDMMGKYASNESGEESDEEYFNLFRGLTTPYKSDYIDPEISGNNVITYDANTSSFVKTNICNYLDNSNLINGTNISKDCEETRYSGIIDEDVNGDGDTRYSGIIDEDANGDGGNKCIANYGETINSKYKNYVCNENEQCVGYECGVKFGKCSPVLL